MQALYCDAERQPLTSVLINGVRILIVYKEGLGSPNHPDSFDDDIERSFPAQEHSVIPLTLMQRQETTHINNGLGDNFLAMHKSDTWEIRIVYNDDRLEIFRCITPDACSSDRDEYKCLFDELLKILIRAE
ncbi:MAG: hypothetical protein EBY22_17275 [Gammaproteobacteria bacterium]|nr:hypothetical protein [Gammaproteobacteria bacterium]